MNKSEQINELAMALCKAQSAMSGASKDATNPFFKSKYADLQSCWEAARKPLADNGLSVAQMVEGNCLETILMHSSGQWISSSAIMNPVKNDPQGLGSCISYFRRYIFSSMIGLYQVDDDGQSASGSGGNLPQREPMKPMQKSTQVVTTSPPSRDPREELGYGPAPVPAKKTYGPSYSNVPSAAQREEIKKGIENKYPVKK